MIVHSPYSNPRPTKDDELSEGEEENWAAATLLIVLIVIAIYGGTVWFFTMSGFYVD
jgi:hypothetical protein